MTKSYKKPVNWTVNFGPQHPAAHGVLRLIVELDGEVVKRADPHIGLLHRGTEKLMESRTILQALPYLDRLDYVSMMAQEHAYSLTIEAIAGVEVPRRAMAIRVLFAEITRLLNHILAITTHVMDVGATTPFLWAFEDREKLMEFYERVSGARLHAAFFRPGGVSADLPEGLLEDIYKFSENFILRITEWEEMLNNNRILKNRLKNVGIVSLNDALKLSFSGVMIRGSGCPLDLRKSKPYDLYNEVNFKMPIGTHGDSYDRLLIRMQELKESIHIMKQIIDKIEPGSIKTQDKKFLSPERGRAKGKMEELIAHFKSFTEGNSAEGISYQSVEAPKGEFGVLVQLAGDRLTVPYRVRLRSPGFFHLQGVDHISRGLLLGDLVTVVGTTDLVFGEIDR